VSGPMGDTRRLEGPFGDARPSCGWQPRGPFSRMPLMTSLRMAEHAVEGCATVGVEEHLQQTCQGVENQVLATSIAR
jgi:hypothetical protein